MTAGMVVAAMRLPTFRGFAFTEGVANVGASAIADYPEASVNLVHALQSLTHLDAVVLGDRAMSG
jgi:hypothetical protein